MRTRTTPSAIFTASAASEGAIAGLGGLLPVAVTVIVTTIASDTSHPNTYAAPFNVPRLDGRTTMNAVSGSGSEVDRQADQHEIQDHGRISRLTWVVTVCARLQSRADGGSGLHEHVLDGGGRRVRHGGPFQGLRLPP